MDYLYQINQKKSDFTDVEKKIADFVINNPEALLEMTSIKLGEETGTSQSAVIRFVKKIGYSGYLEFKIDVAKNKGGEKLSLINEPIKEEDNLDTIIKKSKSQLESLIEGTYKLLSEETLNKAIEKISTADRIYLAGVAASGLICDDFSYKLKRVSNKVAYERDSHTNLASISHITCKDSLL